MKKLSDNNFNQSSSQKNQKYFTTTFELAKQLIYSLPIVPTNDRIYELVQDIERGDFDDISSVEDAKQHWDQWVERTKEILRGRGIIASRLKKLNKLNK